MGVPFGTPIPAHVLASYPGIVSPIVGTSGSRLPSQRKGSDLERLG
jgi:hypothetical protein